MNPLKHEAAVREVIWKLAPEADGEVVGRSAYGIAMVALMARLAEPARHRKGQVAAETELKELNRRVRRLSDSILALDHDAILALMKVSGISKTELNDYFDELREDISKAQAFLAKHPDLFAASSDDRGASRVHFRVAERAMNVFAQLTARAPARGRNRITATPSACIRFVKSVFEALDIGGSADHYIKQVEESRKKS